MKTLITGATGFLGRYLAESFVNAGHNVRAFARRTSQTKALEKLGVEIVRGDLKDPASLARATEGMETIVHAAAAMSGAPQEYTAATADGTRDDAHDEQRSQPREQPSAHWAPRRFRAAACGKCQA